MAEMKTVPTSASVEAFLNKVEDERKRADSFAVLELMQRVTGEPAVMWGDAIVGFGQHHYCYESGREGDWPLCGFSPRKQSLTLYIMGGFENYEALMARLGKHKTGKACLYINRLSDVDPAVLEELVRNSAAFVKAQHCEK
jgi:hypothetical protein